MLKNIKRLYLHCVFHGIIFKVNNEDWLSGIDSLFSFYKVKSVTHQSGYRLFNLIECPFDGQCRNGIKSVATAEVIT